MLYIKFGIFCFRKKKVQRTQHRQAEMEWCATKSVKKHKSRIWSNKTCVIWRVVIIDIANGLDTTLVSSSSLLLLLVLSFAFFSCIARIIVVDTFFCLAYSNPVYFRLVIVFVNVYGEFSTFHVKWCIFPLMHSHFVIHIYWERGWLSVDEVCDFCFFQQLSFVLLLLLFVLPFLKALCAVS